MSMICELTTAGHTVKAQLFVTVKVRALTARATESEARAAETPFFILSSERVI